MRTGQKLCKCKGWHECSHWIDFMNSISIGMGVADVECVNHDDI